MNDRTPPRGTLGSARGTALYLGAILGPGVLALPGLAARAAGPAALVAWVTLLVLSVPVAATFAELAARRPDAGGVATFTRAAFGDRAAAVCGWWFFSVIPVGASSAALVGAAYIADAAGLGSAATTAIAAALLAIAFAANHIGLRLSGGAQLVLMGLLIALLAVACVAALPHFDPANLRPFAPHGIPGILSAAAVLFYAFSGWEAASHLSGEFADPARQLRRVTALALLIVATVYLALATATAGALGGSAAESPVPLTDLLAYGFGPAAAPLTAVCAALLSLGAMNTFIAGASRLGAALARDGAMPAPLAKGCEPGRTPHRSLAVLAVLTGTAFIAATWFGLGLDTQMRATSAVLAAVTVLACAAAVRLLHGHARVRAVVATACTAAIATALSWYLLLPLGIAVLAYLYLRAKRLPPRRTPARREAVPVSLQVSGSRRRGPRPTAHRSGQAGR
ncbi:APC family permease [Glycomyces sp. NPDC048151]|uniref:APC family permease n=1 Tax=Glycomyces sp. NPDC048151 TaxID=3364002 RepID=UPI0037149228